jgi:hypothetical protein
MSVVRELITKWGFDVEEGPIKALEKDIAGVKQIALAAGAALVAMAGAAAGLVAKFADTADELGKTSKKLGINIEDLQELQHAAELADVSNGALAGGIRFLNRAISAAYGGSKQAVKAFDDLGISFVDAQGNARTAKDVLYDLADQAQATGGAALRGRAGALLLGRGVAELIPMLAGGSAELRTMGLEARQMGIFTAEDARASEEFNDTITRVKQSIFGALIPAFEAILPVAQDYASQIKDWIADHRELIALKVKEWLTGIVKGVQGVIGWGGKLVSVVRNIIAWLGGAEGAAGKLLDVFQLYAAYKVASIFTGIMTALWTVVEAMIAAKAAGQGMFLAWAASGGPIVLFIAALSAAIYAIWENWDVIQRKAVDIIDFYAGILGFDKLPKYGQNLRPEAVNEFFGQRAGTQEAVLGTGQAGAFAGPKTQAELAELLAQINASAAAAEAAAGGPGGVPLAEAAGNRGTIMQTNQMQSNVTVEAPGASKEDARKIADAAAQAAREEFTRMLQQAQGDLGTVGAQ